MLVLDNNKEKVPCVGIFYKVEVPDNVYPNIIINIIGNIPDIIICTIRGVKILYITTIDTCFTCIFNTK